MGIRADLMLIEGNPETVRETITRDDDGQPLDLTGLTIEFWIKPDSTVPDADPSVVKLSTTSGEITVTDAAAGVCSVAVPPQSAGKRWRRLDVVNGTDRKTAVYGNLIVVDV